MISHSNVNPGSFCDERRDDIILYIFGEMGPGASEAFGSHLASCAGCRAEADSLTRTLEIMGDASLAAAGSVASTNGDSLSWESEWTLLRRRLMAGDAFESVALPFRARTKARTWLLRAATVALTAGLAFSAGYLWRGRAFTPPDAAADRLADTLAPPPVSGAASGNYFDSLEDFSRDTHNFLRRTRMLLMEFSNLGADSDPMFFRRGGAGLLAEVGRYREVAERMKNRKVGDLLDQISGILAAISRMEPSNQTQVIREVKATLDITGLIAALEILDQDFERNLKVRSHV